MLDWRVLGGALLAMIVAWGATSSSTRAYPIVAGRDLGPSVAAIEAAASLDPEDAEALGDLAEAYLTRNAPGLAEAAIARAPEDVRGQPAIAHLRGRALAALGNASVALTLQRSVLATCAKRENPCSRTLEGRAEHHAAWLEEMVRLGVEDAHRAPARALLAYRLSTREVRLDIH